MNSFNVSLISTFFDWYPKLTLGICKGTYVTLGIYKGVDRHQSRKKVHNMTKVGQIWLPLCILATVKTAKKCGWVQRKTG